MSRLYIKYREEEGVERVVRGDVYADWDDGWLVIRKKPTKEESWSGWKGDVQEIIPSDRIEYVRYG